jgi:integrase
MSNYIFKRGAIYYYRRRVPEYIRPYETRSSIKISLGTRDEKEAVRKAAIYNDYIEDFWRSLIKAGNSDNLASQYRATVKLAKAHGFTYKSVAEIATSPLEDVVARVTTASQSIDSPQVVSSALGGMDQPDVLLSACLDTFWSLSADRLANKSDDQIRKWKNPRIAALNNFIHAVGDKPLRGLTRRDVLQYRQWWLDRVQTGDVVAATVNKNIMYIRDLLRVVGMHYEIDTDFDILFAKTKLKETEQSRPPFDAGFVQNTLLCPGNLKGLNDEARLLIYAMADTGARESELVGLLEEDIILDAEIPHIWIRPRKNRALKTPTSERKIPLVGASYYAFSNLTHGFSHYRNADTASTTINKYLRENDLKPTPKHSLYSLRHTFKDRLRDSSAPEEVIDELMGHKSSGPKYGRGHILETKYEWMKKIAFTV